MPVRDNAKLLKSTERAIFLSGAGEDARLFAVDGPWAGVKEKATPAVIILQPFAEEMNRCRRLVTQLQGDLAEYNIASLTIDYFGTGDSAGEFEHARLPVWAEDARRACQLALDAGASELIIVGLRFGATLALDLASAWGEEMQVRHLYAVAPTQNYKRAMRQFLRIASPIISAEQPALQAPSTNTAALLETGADAEVGGYLLSSALYNDFMSQTEDTRLSCPVDVMFVAGAGLDTPDDMSLSVSQSRYIAALEARAHPVRAEKISDKQPWYQGVPEETATLTQKLAEHIAQRSAQKSEHLQ